MPQFGTAQVIHAGNGALAVLCDVKILSIVSGK
jgi:hypothetical protein